MAFTGKYYRGALQHDELKSLSVVCTPEVRFFCILKTHKKKLYHFITLQMINLLIEETFMKTIFSREF